MPEKRSSPPTDGRPSPTPTPAPPTLVAGPAAAVALCPVAGGRGAPGALAAAGGSQQSAGARGHGGAGGPAVVPGAGKNESFAAA